MTKPVTWEQIIKAAADNGGSVGVQANKYEGYVVWINALIQGAGGEIVNDTRGRARRQGRHRLRGRQARGRGHQAAGGLQGRPVRPVGVQRGHRPATFGRAAGRVPGQLDVRLQQLRGRRSPRLTGTDLGWARYPETVAGEASQPPIGGIDIGVGAYSEHRTTRWRQSSASRRTRRTRSQLRGSVPATCRPARPATTTPTLQKIYPEDLLELFRTSLDAAGPRPVSPYWSDISSAIQSTWHPPSRVDAGHPEGLRSSSSRTSCTERRCCEHDGDRTASTPSKRPRQPATGREPRTGSG